MISVCIATYRAHAEPNLASLGRDLDSALAGEHGEMVVALNGIDRLSAGVPDAATAVDLGVNRGVAAGWNAAASAARGDLLVFCNDDVRLGPGSLASIAAALRDHPQAGVVGPVGSRWDIVAGRHLDWVQPTAPGQLSGCEVVSGFLFGCRRRIWDAVGGFDEHYAPASWEEVDFCTAVRAAGMSCYVVGGIACEHEWGVSRRQLPWARVHWEGRSETWRSVHRRNMRRFLEKWAHHPVARVSIDAVPPT